MSQSSGDRERAEKELEEQNRIVRLFEEMLSGSPIHVDDRQRQVVEGVLLKLVQEGWIKFAGVDEHGMTYQIGNPLKTLDK